MSGLDRRTGQSLPSGEGVFVSFRFPSSIVISHNPSFDTILGHGSAFSTSDQPWTNGLWCRQEKNATMAQ
jgi:hypothetical protein